MSGFKTMLKMNIRLLLRNKGYLALLVILPILSVLMLNMGGADSMVSEENNYTIFEMNKDTDKIINLTNIKLCVKVYDSSQSELSEYIINELAKTGSYQVYRLKSEPMDLEEARAKALDSGNKNVIGAVIYFPDTFETEILQGRSGNAVVFEATKDGRIKLLESNYNSFLQSIYDYAAVTGYNKTEMLSLLETSIHKEAVKETVNIEVGNSLNLSKQQQGSSLRIGYSMAFLTIGFLFSGVFIAATVVEERNNRVYNRIVLSPSSLMYYGLVKFILILITVVLQTGVIAVAYKLLVNKDFGISFMGYLFLVFCLGLIFNSFSVVIGVLTNNVLTANYIAFMTWCISCVLAGLYFPLDAASDWWAKLSMMMPQRWVVKVSEMLMTGKNDAYNTYILVVVSYLFIIASVGFMGIKIRKRD